MFEGMSFQEKLEATHSFPCSYAFKVIGHQGRGLAEGAAAIAQAMGRTASISSRPSKKGRFESVTVAFQVTSAAEVEDVYQKLRALDGAQMLL